MFLLNKCGYTYDQRKKKQQKIVQKDKFGIVKYMTSKQGQQNADFQTVTVI